VAHFLSYINWFTVEDADEPAAGWLHAISNAGYDGVQLLEPLPVDLLTKSRRLSLGVCGSGRVNRAEDAWRLAQEAREHGLECLTLHVGWGYEEEDAACRLIEAILDASARTSVPMYVETHRATIFQDIWRTVSFIRRFPELRFNADWSHWYTGLEFVYGDFDRKLDFVQPVIDRVDFMHGRISDPGCIQVDIGNFANALKLPYVQHFRTMWTRTFKAFLARSAHDAQFRFATELLPSKYYYARDCSRHVHDSRWSQALVLTSIAKDCFASAITQHGESPAAPQL